MIYYATAFALTLLLCKWQITPEITDYGDRVNTLKHKRNTFLALMPLILLALFRWNVGADSVYGASYSTAYQAAAEGINKFEFEIGFYWFMRLFAGLKIPFFWFLFAHGLFFFIVVSYAIRRGSANATWSIAVLFLLTIYFDSYSSLRQSLAEAIGLVGWALMGSEKKGIKKDAAILTLFTISMLFHSTGLLNIPIYLLCKLRFKRRVDVLIFAFIALAMTPVLQRVLPVIMNALSNNENYTTIGLARINLVVTGLFFLITWLFYDQIVEANPNGYMYVNQALFIFILIVNSGAMYLPYRVYDMLKIGYVFIIPQVVCSMGSNSNRLIVQAVYMVVCIALFVNFATQPNNSIYMNYQTALSDWWHITLLP